MKHLDELIETECLDEYTNSKLLNFIIATDEVSDKGFEVFVIVLTKIVLIVISVSHVVCMKRGSFKFKDFEALVFERKTKSEDHVEIKRPVYIKKSNNMA